MDFHRSIPIWVMITFHVLNGDFAFLFSCNAGNEGEIVLGGHNNV